MSAKIMLFTLLMLSAALPSLFAQELPPITVRPRPSEEVVLAAVDVQPANRDKAAELSETLRTFNQVLWEDLSFSGFFTMAAKSFYPPQPIVRPEDLNYDAWNGLAFKVSYITAGTLDLVGGSLLAELRIFDARSRRMSFGQKITGNPDQIRAMAHRR